MIPYEFSAERFSRWMSYVLRHNPDRYGLQHDRHGFVDLEAFLSVARQRYPDVTAERLRGLIDETTRRRFEISGNRLRARYGHSIPVSPPGEPVRPPARLYHGTEPERAEQVRAEGLRPVDRRMVHLSSTIEDAVAVASRRTSSPVVLRVAAGEADEAGVAFFCEGAIYLAAQIPPQFLSVEPLPAPEGRSA